MLSKRPPFSKSRSWIDLTQHFRLKSAWRRQADLRARCRCCSSSSTAVGTTATQPPRPRYNHHRPCHTTVSCFPRSWARSSHELRAQSARPIACRASHPSSSTSNMRGWCSLQHGLTRRGKRGEMLSAQVFGLGPRGNDGKPACYQGPNLTAFLLLSHAEYGYSPASRIFQSQFQSGRPIAPNV